MLYIGSDGSLWDGRGGIKELDPDIAYAALPVLLAVQVTKEPPLMDASEVSCLFPLMRKTGAACECANSTLYPKLWSQLRRNVKQLERSGMKLSGQEDRAIQDVIEVSSTTTCYRGYQQYRVLQR